MLHYTLPLLLGLMIDWKIDTSYGLLGVWYTDKNLYLYLQYKHFEIIYSICSTLAYNHNKRTI